MLAALPRPAAVWLTVVATGGVIPFVAGLWRLPTDLAAYQTLPVSLALALLLLLTAAAFGTRPVRFGPSTKLHLGAAPLFCAALLFPPAFAGLIAYLSALGHNLRLRRRPWNALYNAAQHLLTTGCASLLYRDVQSAIPGSLGVDSSLLTAGGAYFLISTVLAGTMASLAQRQPWLQGITNSWRTVWAHYLTLLTFGWFAALSATTALWSLPLLAVPVAIAYRLDHTLGDLLETRRQLTEALERQRQFVGDVAHELGAPLTSVTGNAAVLLSDPALPEEVRETLDDIHAEASRTAKLLQDLLLLSTVEEGRRLAFAPVSLRQVAEHVLRLCRTAADANGSALALAGAAAGWVLGSQALLEQLALNLVENAIKYGPPGQPIQVALAERAGQVELSVSDHGPGIPPEQLARLFERHYRAGAGESRGRGGAGLGLAIARRIAEVHGGRLTAESVAGQGNRFTLALPPPGFTQPTP